MYFYIILVFNNSLSINGVWEHFNLEIVQFQILILTIPGSNSLFQFSVIKYLFICFVAANGDKTCG